MKTDFDLVIIGAGIVGAFSAYLAAKKHPGLRILLIDRGLVGNGATQYSIGLDYPYGHTALKQDMTKESRVIWDDLKNIVADLQREVPLYGLVSANNFSKVKEGLTNKFEITATTNSDKRITATIDPLLQEDQLLLAGLHCKYSHTREIAQRLARHFCAMNEKNRLWEGVNVNAIKPLIRGYSLELEEHQEIKTKKILLTTGAWTTYSNFIEFFKDVKIRTKKIVSLFIDKPPPAEDPAFFFFDEDAFLLPMVDDHRWLFSFTIYSWDCDPNMTSWPITKEDRRVGMSILKKYIPKYASYCHGGRAFCDSYHHDWTPIICPSAEHDGVVMAAGGSGSGFRLAPAMANRALTQLGL